MRGSMMRLFTAAQHERILGKHSDNPAAAAEYSKLCGKEVSRQLVKYWRTIFQVNAGNMAAADRALAEQRQFIKPSPDDDIGDISFLKQKQYNSILVIPDMHAPYQHQDTMRFLRAVRDAFSPDLVVNLGDELDHHALSFHDSDPNLDSAGMELERAKKVMHELHAEFPQMLICHSNHGSMHYRRSKAHGIPVQMIRKYRDILFPGGEGRGWSWAFGWRVDTAAGPVLFRHQSANILGDAAHEGANLMVGHSHGNYSVQYSASSHALYWGAYGGCLIDKDSMAFAYGKHTSKKPIVGCTVILDGKPMLIPMVLTRKGRWTNKL